LQLRKRRACRQSWSGAFAQRQIHQVSAPTHHDRVRTWRESAIDGIAKVGPTRGIPVVAFDVIRYIVIRSSASFDHPRNGVDLELSSTMSI
jgi:hypothetical protein